MGRFATNISPADDLIITYEYPLKIDACGQMLAGIMAKKMAVGSGTYQWEGILG